MTVHIMMEVVINAMVIMAFTPVIRMMMKNPFQDAFPHHLLLWFLSANWHKGDCSSQFGNTHDNDYVGRGGDDYDDDDYDDDDDGGGGGDYRGDADDDGDDDGVGGLVNFHHDYDEDDKYGDGDGENVEEEFIFILMIGCNDEEGADVIVLMEKMMTAMLIPCVSEQ